MKPLYLLLLSLLILTSCRTKKARLFSKEMLPNQHFTIDNSRDTTIKTLHGALIRINKNTFAGSAETEIEIKEALTAAEIFAAGLTTTSDDRLLRSGGMIYINAMDNDGDTLQLLKPIKVSIPNQFFDSSMMVFKGVETSNTINWVNPSSPDSNTQSKNWFAGKAIFESKCSQCHSIFREMTGPALADVEYRGPWTKRENLYSFIKNPQDFIAKNQYAHRLQTSYSSVMTPFPALTKQDIDLVLDYIKNESASPPVVCGEEGSGLTLPAADGKNEITKLCKDDTIYFDPSPNFNTLLEEAENIDKPGDPIEAAQNNDTIAPFSDALRSGFTDPNGTAGMYDFEIATLGWYNIDAFMEGEEGTDIVELFVRIKSDFDLQLNRDMSLYLFVPNNKSLSVLNKQDGNIFSFDKLTGGIPLFIGEKGILFAFGSIKDQLYYGIKDITIEKTQTVDVTLKETSEEELKAAIMSRQINGIEIGFTKKEMKILKNECDWAQPDTAIIQ